MIISKPIFAVLSGDLIGSTRLSPPELKRAREGLFQAIAELKKWKKDLVRGKPEFFRGDAWQMLLTDPAFALRVTLFLRARLKAQKIADTKIAIGMGTVDEIVTKRISLSSGEAFTLSGHALDNLNSLVRITLALPLEAGPFAQWMPVVGGLCDSLVSPWKQRQAEIVALALLPCNLQHDEIAQKLDSKVTRQAVSKSLAGANWHSLKMAVEQFERTDWESVCQATNFADHDTNEPK